MTKAAEKPPAPANMVLRTVYLPIELDEELKSAALLTQASKNDVIRDLISIGLEKELTLAAKAVRRNRNRLMEPVEVDRPRSVDVAETGENPDWQQLVAQAAQSGEARQRPVRRRKAVSSAD